MPPSEELTPVQRLAEFVGEAQEIRASVPSPREEIDPGEYLHLAARHRQAVDRLEAIYGSVMLIRWQSIQRRAVAEAALEDAEVDLQVSFDDFTSARERDLKIKTLTITRRRALRMAQRDVTDAMEAERFLRLVHSGAESARRDLDSRLRALGIITQFER